MNLFVQYSECSLRHWFKTTKENVTVLSNPHILQNNFCSPCEWFHFNPKFLFSLRFLFSTFYWRITKEHLLLLVWCDKRKQKVILAKMCSYALETFSIISIWVIVRNYSFHQHRSVLLPYGMFLTLFYLEFYLFLFVCPFAFDTCYLIFFPVSSSPFTFIYCMFSFSSVGKFSLNSFKFRLFHYSQWKQTWQYLHSMS